jgi:ankyrin repeat protein
LIGLSMAALMCVALPARDAAAQGEINSLLILPRAASIDDYDSVLGLLQGGASVDTEGEDDRAALSFAAANGNMQILDLLLDHLANVGHRDRFGDTALHWAALNGRLDACRRLIAAKAEVNAQNGQGVTPLMMAIGNNRRDVARLLLTDGADVKLQDYTGHDALEWARDKPTLLAIVQAGATH